jgi:type II secretory pathway component PulF
MANSSPLRFTEMLLALLQGGTNLIDALAILSKTGKEAGVGDIAVELLAVMKRGFGFSDALALALPESVLAKPLYLTLLKSAEMTGSVTLVLEHIAEDLRRRQKTRENIITVLLYPALIILIAFAGTAALLVKGLPLFVNTGLLSGAVLSQAINGIIFAGLFLLASGAASFIACYNIFGKDSAPFRVFYLLSFLLRGNVALPDALSRCVAAVGETKYARALVLVKKDISSGVRLSEAFSRTGVFSGFVSGWLAVADRNGDIKTVCCHIADYFQKRDERVRGIASRCVEPVIIVITGIYLLILIQGIVLPLLTRAGGII